MQAYKGNHKRRIGDNIIIVSFTRALYFIIRLNFKINLIRSTVGSSIYQLNMDDDLSKN